VLDSKNSNQTLSAIRGLLKKYCNSPDIEETIKDVAIDYPNWNVRVGTMTAILENYNQQPKFLDVIFDSLRIEARSHPLDRNWRNTLRWLSDNVKDMPEAYEKLYRLKKNVPGIASAEIGRILKSWKKSGVQGVKGKLGGK
jgi:hypothetical protein